MQNPAPQPVVHSTRQAPLLEAREVGRRAPGTHNWLLQKVSFHLLPGERVAIMGATGSGKTLLLRSLALLDPIDSGEVLWQGQPISPAAIPGYRSKVIYLHQRAALFPGTIEENLRLPFQLKSHLRQRFDRDRLVHQLQSIGRTAEFLQRPVRDLSGGERQLTALLRGLQLQPAVLLLDEPTASLDSESARQVETLVLDWQKSASHAFVWVSHQPDQAHRIGQRTLTMSHGQLKEPA